MNFTIIGTGFIMPRHADAIYSVGGKIVDLVNTSRGEKSWREAIARKEADCVVILTPNDLHFEMALAAAKENKIVLCEKPLAIRMADVEVLRTCKNIFTVLQLRHHPTVKKLENEITEKHFYEIEMDISVHRDEKYYLSWKGQKARSGGILFNLGIHYFDLLLYLFGWPTETQVYSTEEETARGSIGGVNYLCDWRLSTAERRDKQRRVFRINGVDYNFSSRDNLSQENLHRLIYQDLLNGRGVLPDEVMKSVRLVEDLHGKVLGA